MSFKDLPQELLDKVAAYVWHEEDLIRLRGLSNRMTRAVDHELFSAQHQGPRNRAMAHACRTGLVPFIRRLVVDCGVDASVVRIPYRFPRPTAPTQPRGFARKMYDLGFETSTLMIAVARGQVDAFRVLLALGARIDVPGVQQKVHKMLVKRICSPKDDWGLLRTFFEEGVDSQMQSEHHASFTLPLLHVIQAPGQTSPPTEQVRLLLERGAGEFVNQFHSVYRHNLVTPLTVTILQTQYDPIPILDLLHGAGALINGPQYLLPLESPIHIPILAAAERMIKSGDQSVMDWCLRNGADLCVQVLAGSGKYYANRDLSSYYYNSTTANPQTEAILLPRPGMWPVEYILWQWTMMKKKTADPIYRRIVEWLVRHTITRGINSIIELLLRAENALQGYYTTPWNTGGEEPNAEIVEVWIEIVRDLILKESQVTPTKLLSGYIISKGLSGSPFQSAGRATIDLLLEEGGDINATSEDDSTVLHRLCKAYGASDRVELWGSHRSTMWAGQVNGLIFFAHLRRKGADVNVDFGGRTAREILLQNTSDREDGVLGMIADLLQPEGSRFDYKWVLLHRDVIDPAALLVDLSEETVSAKVLLS
ncbi:hypothetical protein BDV19DRAFT_367282 [Aspergillus venezuelensis]